MMSEKLASSIGPRAMLTLAAAAMLTLAIGCSTDEEPTTEADPANIEVPAFTNVAPNVLGRLYQVSNYRPGVAIFDYDRDGDQDIYITQEAGNSNRMFRNDGDLTFTDVAETAGAAATEQGSSGVVACDVNNDGYQDLYVGGRGIEGDGLDFRSAQTQGDNAAALRAAYADKLLLNLGDGTFEDVSDDAFGGSPNLRSAATVTCADVDLDGWPDIFVANLIDEDFFFLGGPNHPGHFNVLLHNQGDGTFVDVSEFAGIQGDQVWMRDQSGAPLTYTDDAGTSYEGYDPSHSDRAGNRIGDPTGPTHGAVFFDYNDDRLPDLWVSTDGDFLELYRNRSTPGSIGFEPVAQEMGFPRVGNWMGFAVGDYDADGQLDVFATNVGYHLRLKPPQPSPGPDCKYNEQFSWGTCLNAMLRLNQQGIFEDVAPSIQVEPSELMSPPSLDPANLDPAWPVPTGLAAYDFGYGATFFDMDNDGYEDLYWLGSELAAGSGPGGNVYQAAGRMLRNDRGRGFQDVTVESRLLDIMGVKYDRLHELKPGQDPVAFKLSPRYHENGKGLAHGDLNGDGYVDLIGTNSSGLDFGGDGQQFDWTPGPTFMWINQPGDNHWITLRLQGRMAIDGTGSNADGIGARVYLKASLSGEDEPITQVREVKAGSSYLSMDTVELEFGLGSTSIVDEVRIIWPSGRTQLLTDLPADQVVTVTEPTENAQ